MTLAVDNFKTAGLCRGIPEMPSQDGVSGREESGPAKSIFPRKD